LMLIITIGLAGTAYVYISGMLTTKMEKTISVLDASCDGTSITLVIANDGTDQIDLDPVTGELAIYVDNVADTGYTAVPVTLPARQTAVITALTAPGTGSTVVLVVSPSNSVRQSVWC